MGTYILKRLVIMVFTLILISLVIFLIINAAPGRAGQTQLSGGQGESVRDQAGAREGYLLFKLQYGLDQPLLWNTRFNLDIETVRPALETVTQNLSQTIPGEGEALHVGVVTGNIVTRLAYPEYFELGDELDNPDLTADERADIQQERLQLEFTPATDIRPPRPEPEALVDAQESLENWGMYAVPALIEIARNHPNAKARWQSVEYLTLNAQDRHVDPETGAIRANIPERRFQRLFMSVSIPADGFIAGAGYGPGGVTAALATASMRVIQPRLRALLPRSDLDRWTFDLGAAPEDEAEVIALWNDWFARNAARWEHDFGDKVGIFLTETRLFTYWSRLIQGDFGISSQYRQPVLGLIFSKWKYSIYLSVLAILLSYFLAVPIGLYSAVKRGGLFDRGMSLVLFLFYSLPSFFAATLLQDHLTRAKSDHEVFLILAWIVMLLSVVAWPLIAAFLARERLAKQLRERSESGLLVTMHREMGEAMDSGPLPVLAVVLLAMSVGGFWHVMVTPWGWPVAILLGLSFGLSAWGGKGRSAVLAMGAFAAAVGPGWMFAKALFEWGGILLALLLILIWPLTRAVRSYRREKADAERAGDTNPIPLPIGRWAGYVFAGAGVTAIFVLMKGYFPAPVSGFSTTGLRIQSTTWDYFIDVIMHLVMPVLCLTYGSLAYLSRYARTGLLDVINSDYIRTARAKGLSESVVILKHALRNGMIPILTLMATALPYLVGGSVIIEYIFDIPGMGNLIYDAVIQKDFNVVMGVLQISALMTLIGVLVSDISYAIVDPRIKFD